MSESEQWQEQEVILSDYKDVQTTPHLQANRLIRDIEHLYKVKFGKEGIATVHRHYDQVYSHFWELLEKAELRNSKHD